MSTGELCGARIKIGTQINGTNTIEVCCDCYAGHEGDHQKEFYHTYKNEESVLINQRLGNIKWK